MAGSNPPIQYVIRNEQEFKSRHDKRLRELKDMRTPYRNASIYLDRWVQKNFKTEGGNVGGWQPLKAGGRWIKGKGLDTSAKILQDTGRLRSSFLPFASARNGGIGSDLPYSFDHENPKESGRKGLPKRRMLPKHSEVGKDLKSIIREYTDKVMHK